MFRIVKRNVETGHTEIVMSDLHGAPLSREQAERFASRLCFAEADRNVTYDVEFVDDRR